MPSMSQRTARLLTILFEIAAVSAGDFLGWDLIRLTELQGIEDCASHILDHHSSLDRRLRRPADGEDTMVFHQDGRAGSDRTEDFLPDLVPTNFGIRPDRDVTAELIADGCQHGRDRPANRCPGGGKG